VERKKTFALEHDAKRLLVNTGDGIIKLKNKADPYLLVKTGIKIRQTTCCLVFTTGPGENVGINQKNGMVVFFALGGVYGASPG
jgi:hypothetical protein